MKLLDKRLLDADSKNALAADNVAEIVRILTDNVRVGSCGSWENDPRVSDIGINLVGDLVTPVTNLQIIDRERVQLCCSVFVADKETGMVRRLRSKITLEPPPKLYVLSDDQAIEVRGANGIGFIDYDGLMTQITLFFEANVTDYDQLSQAELVIYPPHSGNPIRLYLPFWID